MSIRPFGLALVGLGFALAAGAAPLPPALEKFYREGIRLSSENPVLIKGIVAERSTQRDAHFLQLVKGQKYDVTVAAAFPLTLRVEEVESGTMLYSSTTPKASVLAPEDGLYRVTIVAAPGMKGSYALTIAHHTVPKSLDSPGVRTVGRAGLSISSNLMDGDAIDKVRRHTCKTFQVRLSAGKSYVIDMMSMAFDSYLRLEDPAGRQLAQDDDGGDGLNSRISFRAAADGIYTIVCTSFSGGGGEFTMMVREE